MAQRFGESTANVARDDGGLFSRDRRPDGHRVQVPQLSQVRENAQKVPLFVYILISWLDGFIHSMAIFKNRHVLGIFEEKKLCIAFSPKIVTN